MASMERAGVETRPVFYCAHVMPPHRRTDVRLPVAEEIAARGISLPSYPALSDGDIDRVCQVLVDAIG